MTQKKGKGKCLTTAQRKGSSLYFRHLSPYLPTPSPVGSARLLTTHHLRQTSSKRLFQEDDDFGWNSLPVELWMNIIERFKLTHKESVVHLGMCSKNLKTIVSENFARNMSLRSMYVKLPGFSPKLLHSLDKWWKVHSNVDAGIMHGLYQAWYAGNWSKGLEILTEVVVQTNDAQALYMANIVYRSPHCEDMDPPPAGESFARGGKDNHKLSEYRTNLRKMVSCYAMQNSRRGHRCMNLSDNHQFSFNSPPEEYDCSDCLFDAEAFNHRGLWG